MSDDPAVFSCLLEHVERINRVELFTTYPMRQVADDVSESQPLLSVFRRLMEETHADATKVGRFIDFSDFAAELDAGVASDYREGLVAAVDGTDQLPPTSLAATTIYAVEVFGKTSQTSAASVCKVSTTRASSPTGRGTPDIYELARILDEARGVSASSSFTTFREYQERLFALEELPAGVQTCMIDGPIFTQNLLTQEAGRQLLDRMVNSGRRFVGIIKNLSGSWALCKWAAYCLLPGEAYVIGTLAEQFAEDRARAAHGASDAVKGWLSSDRKRGYVRVVYRPKQTAFAFECHTDDLPYIVALLRFDASAQVGHEMPRLMQFVDGEARRANTSGKAQEKLVSEVAKRNKRLANDIDDERRSR